jgi:transcription initiation factor TFIID TATA-box-binding protein
MGKIEGNSLLASREDARILSKLTFNAKLSKFTFQGSSNVKFPIHLEGLSYSHRQFSSYNPEVVVLVIDDCNNHSSSA